MKCALLTHPKKFWSVNTDFIGHWYGTEMSTRNHDVFVAKAQYYIVNTANLCGALDDRIEYRLHIGGRAADDAEHFRGRRLMLQCLAQFCVALLDFLEQPNVLDGDDSLGGEG